MKCDEVRGKLSAYVDGELGDLQRAVGEHLAECEPCRTLFSEMVDRDVEIREALRMAAPSAGFAGRVVAAAKRPRWVRRLAVAAALLVTLTAAAAGYVNSMEPPPLVVSVHGGESFHADSMGALRVLVSNARTGQPVAAAAVRILLGGTTLGDFTTGVTGTIDGFFRVPDLADGSYPLKLDVRTPIGSEILERHVAVKRERRLLVTTDKPMYQGGQTIRMRALSLDSFTLKPRAGDAEFEVADSKGNRVFVKKARLSDFGIASADMELADEINLGTYRVAVTASGTRQECTVEVAKYVLPKFKVDLEVDKTSYRPGETVKGTVKAKYFFGNPVRGRVKATVDREIVSGELREDGTWEFQAPAPDEGLAKVEVTVTDTADHRETKSTGAMVSRESLKVTLVPEGGAIVRDLENTFYVIVATPDGRPAKADLKLIVNGAYVDVSTDDLGVAQVRAGAPHSIVLSRAHDRAGNETREMRTVAPHSANDFLIRLDKASYRGGETMKVKVLGGGGGPVYIDFIKGGQLLLAKAVDKGELEFDLPADLFGTIQVVAYKRDSHQPVVRVAYVNLPEGLRIRPRAAKETFRPGEEMPVEFEVVDRDGRPIQAALGIAVVDEALYGLVESKLASEKAWLSLAPDLVDTRGFLNADVSEIYAGSHANAQGFVSANGQAARPPQLLENAYAARQRAVEAFVRKFNNTLEMTAIVTAIGVMIALGVVLLGPPLVSLFKLILSAKVRLSVVLVLGTLGAFFLLHLIRGDVESVLALNLFVGGLMYGIYAVVWWLQRSKLLAGLGTMGMLALIIVLYLPLATERSVYRQTAEITGEAGPGQSFDFYTVWKLGGRPLSEPPLGAPKPAAEQPVITKPLRGLGDGEPRPEPARIREYFPETLFWRPELITDEKGRATLTLPAADSITSWRLLASAIARTGALGFENANLRVFQDFFADIDFPVALTKGDRVHVPVAVYNYLKEPQTVAVRVQREPWFEFLDEETKSITLKADEVSVVYFGLKVREHGRKTLTVFADGKVKDAIRRAVDVAEKGREVPVSVSDRVYGRHAFRVEIPERAIDGASVLFARISPGAGDFVTGLEGMVRMPYG